MGYTNKFKTPCIKKTFLNKKYLGITEYISKNFLQKTCMLIYNEAFCLSYNYLLTSKICKKI